MRSAIGITIALLALTLAVGAESSDGAPLHSATTRVVLTWVPRGTSLERLARLGLAPGLLSAGLGSVPAQQTYLDITQGSRVFDSLYDTELPELHGDCPQWWKAVVERAESAPADIVPGLLSTALADAGVGVRARGEASCAFSAHRATGGSGGAPRGSRGSPGSSGAPRQGPASGTFEVREASLAELASLRRSLHGNDLLIAIAKPPPAANRALAIGVAGHGFHGDLTSDSTRFDGYVLSTDLAPTILDRFGLATPSQMSGQPVRAEGAVDPGGVVALGDRMALISHRRGPVIGLSLLAWIVLLGAAIAATRGAAARAGARMLGLTLVYTPAVLLLGAAIEPGEGAETLLVAIASPLLAALTLAALRDYRALAVASGVVVAAYAADVIAGSQLTALSLLGPNPGLGVRFYGIGNELEALLGVLVVAGTGAGLAGFAPGLSRRGCAIAFLAVGMLCALVFASGRFGADVGAAIVLPVGAAVAAAVTGGAARRSALWIVAAPFAILALLAIIDLATGANAHLTRTVLDAGGLSDLSKVAQRRLQLSAHSFVRPVLLVFLPVVVALAVLALVRRDRLRAWLSGSPAMRAGLLGALAATVVGTLANDSGALLLEIGAVYLLVFVAFAWAQSAAHEKAGR